FYILFSFVVIFFFFFFFQAEDGIRDFHVTGVQTCALPILRMYGTCNWPATAYICSSSPPPETSFMMCAPNRIASRATLERKVSRSEERRVGKECRSRWSLEP